MEAIRVVVRIRPPLEKELNEQCRICCREEGEEGNQLRVGDDRTFTFDKVLGPHCTQEVAYDACCAPLVDPYFEGYNCTIFAYGQTGAGKTFSMNGIIRKFLPKIFERIDRLTTQDNIGVMLRVSCMEIYNENVKDLLDTNESKPITVRDGVDGNVVVTGVIEHSVRSYEDLLHFIERSTANRTVASTLMNDTSSRSHSILTLTMEQHVASEVSMTSETVVSKLRLVDLAGSERAKKTGASGQRLKESININTGLLTLGNVIAALCEQQEQPNKKIHIPYRECKLTRVLQDSLGGNSVTVMLACVSPADTNFEETLNTLKYANRAKNIRNKPIKNRDPHAVMLEKLQTDLNVALALLAKHKIPWSEAPNSAGSLASSIVNPTNSSSVQQLSDLQRENAKLQSLVEMCFEMVEQFERSLGEPNGGDNAAVIEGRELGDIVPRLHKALNHHTSSAAVIAQLQQEKHKLERHTKQLEEDLFRAEYSAMSANNERQKLIEDMQQVTIGEGDMHLQHSELQKKQRDIMDQLSRERDEMWKEKVDLENRKCALEIERANFEKRQQIQETAIHSMEDEIQRRESVIRDMLQREAEAQKAQDAYARNMVAIQEQRDKAKVELNRALKELESRAGMGKDAKEREARRIQQVWESKLRTVESALTDLRRKQQSTESQLKIYQAEKEKMRKLQGELTTLKETYEITKEKAKQEALKSDKLRMNAAAQHQHLSRQLKDIETENHRLVSALTKKEEEIIKVKHQWAATAGTVGKTGGLSASFLHSPSRVYPTRSATNQTPSSVHPSQLSVPRGGGGGGGNPTESDLQGYRQMSELRNRLEKEREKLDHAVKEREEAKRLKDDLVRTMSHRKMGDASRVQRSLSGWEFRISSLEKEIALLTQQNDMAKNQVRLEQLLQDKKNAELRYAEVRTLMPALEHTLAERVREADDRIDSLSAAITYHEKSIERLLKDMELLQPPLGNVSLSEISLDEDNMTGPKASNARALLSRSYQKVLVLTEQNNAKERTIKQLAQELVEKQRVIESLNNMLATKKVAS